MTHSMPSLAAPRGVNHSGQTIRFHRWNTTDGAPQRQATPLPRPSRSAAKARFLVSASTFRIQATQAPLPRAVKTVTLGVSTTAFASSASAAPRARHRQLDLARTVYGVHFLVPGHRPQTKRHSFSRVGPRGFPRDTDGPRLPTRYHTM